MTSGVVVTLVLVFFTGAFSAMIAGLFSVLTDKQAREAHRGRTFKEQVRLILN